MIATFFQFCHKQTPRKKWKKKRKKEILCFRKRWKGKKKKSWWRPITRTGEKQLNWCCREAANHAAKDRERRGRAAGQTTSLSSSAIAFSWSWNYAVKSHTHTDTHNLQEKVIFWRMFVCWWNCCYLQFCYVFPRAVAMERLHRRLKTQAQESNPIIGVVQFKYLYNS